MFCPGYYGKRRIGQAGLNSINFLRTGVKNLHTRLTAGIRPRLSWSKFVDETGSELSHRSVGMFYDAIEVGGSAGQAGQHASMFANRLALLRARRRTVAQPFRWLVVVMHAAVVLILYLLPKSAPSGTRRRRFRPLRMEACPLFPRRQLNLSGPEILASLLPLVIVFTIQRHRPALAEAAVNTKDLNRNTSAISASPTATKVAGMFTTVSQY